MTHIIDYTGEIKPKKKSIWNYVLWTMMISNRNNIVALIRQAAIRFHLDEYALCSNEIRIYISHLHFLSSIITIFSAWQIIPTILCFDSVNRVKIVYTSISPSFHFVPNFNFHGQYFGCRVKGVVAATPARTTFSSSLSSHFDTVSILGADK